MDDPMEYGTFNVGDSDLRFLGLVAALAARDHMRRKGGRVFARDDKQAIDRVLDGMAEGADLPLDDVPELLISVHAHASTLARLRQLAPAEQFKWPSKESEKERNNDPPSQP